jgi:chemotaxis protein CheC
VSEISEIERDAITELANIAVGRAAASLRQLVGHEVLLSVPSIDILSREAAAQHIWKAGGRNVVAVSQDFSGPFHGRALLIFPESNSLELVRTIIGRDLPLSDIVDLEDEALAETGNIILNGCISALANMLKRAITMSFPSVMHANSQEMFGRSAGEQDLVLVLHITFDVSHKEIKGYLALLMDLHSMDMFTRLVSEWMDKATGAPAGPPADPASEASKP